VTIVVFVRFRAPLHLFILTFLTDSLAAVKGSPQKHWLFDTKASSQRQGVDLVMKLTHISKFLCCVLGKHQVIFFSACELARILIYKRSIDPSLIIGSI
jgi:hypothetical protein